MFAPSILLFLLLPPRQNDPCPLLGGFHVLHRKVVASCCFQLTTFCSYRTLSGIFVVGKICCKNWGINLHLGECYASLLIYCIEKKKTNVFSVSLVFFPFISVPWKCVYFFFCCSRGVFNIGELLASVFNSL